MIRRTDIHRPSIINGEEYEWVAFQYSGSSDLGAIMAMQEERARFQAHMAATGGKFSGHDHGGICHICGCGNIVYESIFYHAKTNSYIVTGQDCAEKLDLSFGDMNAFRKAISNALEARAGKKKAQAVLENAGLQQCWVLYETPYEQLPGREYQGAGDPGAAPGDPDGQPQTYKAVYSEEITIRDIVGKLVKYGSISEKATAYLRSLLERIDKRAEREAQQAAEKEAAAPCPTGRVRVTGTVLALKVVESSYGYHDTTHTKMLVKDNSGFKVWGSRFNNLERGAAVDMVATIEVSKDDPKFGFFSRPVEYKTKEQKKAESAERKREREALKKQEEELRAANPNYFNAYHPDWGKDMRPGKAREVSC